ncbi:CAMK/CAMKL protein kinase [Fonticula alba]|uniref:non-specific serine/threonine protein kinase n=1 Tax=Fonticula alba TaxID=691883 RepID=A0A058ZC47_FONAL|nr:CAMK/CAMKL protein kinase [Fonticula alba]KCV71012.1 CAMK/CAMKL protein kinase [Fonticula alba]|eukprot:XP_009494135.1 CAMK/CAMKL protein kinase [Fonticula alba]
MMSPVTSAGATAALGPGSHYRPDNNAEMADAQETLAAAPGVVGSPLHDSSGVASPGAATAAGGADPRGGSSNTNSSNSSSSNSSSGSGCQTAAAAAAPGQESPPPGAGASGLAGPDPAAKHSAARPDSRGALTHFDVAAAMEDAEDLPPVSERLTPGPAPAGGAGTTGTPLSPIAAGRRASLPLAMHMPSASPGEQGAATAAAATSAQPAPVPGAPGAGPGTGRRFSVAVPGSGNPMNGARSGASHSSGSMVGKYVLDRVIGQGTYGKVRSATDRLTGEKVAVKIIEKNSITNERQMRRIQKEVRFLRLLTHPHIVRVHDVLETPSSILIVMEHAAGGELFDYIVTRRRVPEKEARAFFRQILSAVDYCHQNFVIHRDLKPENLLLDESRRQIKIIDFGFSNTYDSGDLLNTFCGSPFYAAPEMILGKRYTGPEVDVWSLGVILFALLCGHLPFDHDDVKELYRRIAHASFVIPPHVSAEAKDLIGRMITVNPKRRATMAEIMAHRWVLDGFDGPPDSHLPARDPIDPDFVDPQIVQQIERFGFRVENLLDRLTDPNMPPNPVRSAYYLVKELYEREERRRSEEMALQAAFSNMHMYPPGGAAAAAAAAASAAAASAAGTAPRSADDGSPIPGGGSPSPPTGFRSPVPPVGAGTRRAGSPYDPSRSPTPTAGMGPGPAHHAASRSLDHGAAGPHPGMAPGGPPPHMYHSPSPTHHMHHAPPHSPVSGLPHHMQTGHSPYGAGGGFGSAGPHHMAAGGPIGVPSSQQQQPIHSHLPPGYRADVHGRRRNSVQPLMSTPTTSGLAPAGPPGHHLLHPHAHPAAGSGGGAGGASVSPAGTFAAPHHHPHHVMPGAAGSHFGPGHGGPTAASSSAQPPQHLPAPPRLSEADEDAQHGSPAGAGPGQPQPPSSGSAAAASGSGSSSSSSSGSSWTRRFSLPSNNFVPRSSRSSSSRGAAAATPMPTVPEGGAAPPASVAASRSPGSPASDAAPVAACSSSRQTATTGAGPPQSTWSSRRRGSLFSAAPMAPPQFYPGHPDIGGDAVPIDSEQHQVRTVSLGWFSLSTTSAKTVTEIMTEVARVLSENGIKYVLDSPYVFACDTGDHRLQFELEVCRVKHMNLHGIKGKRLGGSIFHMKKLTARLFAQMNL